MGSPDLSGLRVRSLGRDACPHASVHEMMNLLDKILYSLNQTNGPDRTVILSK